ncbi:hypothetical protein RM704_14325 [Streptomyces sp. DSM 3412]|uniref:Uncharacterized protein n=1 Tax=Streptomyces gottesmaniae TaxID=3075518 RepID=A0ABU2YWC2_9ACTN|nr:hypothetical protein [Streptomyces sp. DSM 3412]MDT0568629.1 hypothetical protein [Streptomyces sp. DSM 3412]
MINEGNRKLYLIFGAQHELGLEKMKDAMWKVGPSYGVLYRDPRDTQRQMLDFVFEPDTAPLRRILRDFISAAPDGRTIPELNRYALLDTVYRPAQVIDAVRQLRNADALTTEPRAINNKTRVHLPRHLRPSSRQPSRTPCGEQTPKVHPERMSQEMASIGMNSEAEHFQDGLNKCTTGLAGVSRRGPSYQVPVCT